MTCPKTTIIEVRSNQAGERLDKFLSNNFSDYSRAHFIKLISAGLVLINGLTRKPSYLMHTGDKVSITWRQEEGLKELEKESHIPLDIIFEDKNVIVLNKQAGVVVHPAAGHPKGTLVNALISHFPKIKEAVYNPKSETSLARPGLVHRLDKDTSGVMVIAKNVRSMYSLSKQIQNRTVKKIYLGICYDWPQNDRGVLESFLGRHPKDRKKIANIGKEKGKEAVTFYKVIDYYYTADNQKVSLVKFDLKTGRTHQIRVQAADMHCPILGDTTYGNKPSTKLSEVLNIKRQLLHSHSLEVYLPGATKLTKFVAPLPNDLIKTLSLLRIAE